MIEIDGSFGEGGGQILRTSLTLAALMGKPLRVVNIRAGRKNPGLAAQHVACANAVRAITGGKLAGAAVGSSVLEMNPGGVSAGNYEFEIGTAGSISLLLHCVYLPLALASEPSRLRLTGGTHVEWSPAFHFLASQWVPLLARMGIPIFPRSQRAGFYPKGGGIVEVEIAPVEGPIRPVLIEKRGPLERVRIVSLAANLPAHIAERQARRAVERMKSRGLSAEVEVERLEAVSPGTCLVICAEFENSSACYSALGRRGKPAEEVSDEACEKMLEFLETDATVDEYTADQILLPLSFAKGESLYRTPRVTRHLTTNAEVIGRFTDAEIAIEGREGQPGAIRVVPSGARLM